MRNSAHRVPLLDGAFRLPLGGPFVHHRRNSSQIENFLLDPCRHISTLLDYKHFGPDRSLTNSQGQGVFGLGSEGVQRKARIGFAKPDGPVLIPPVGFDSHALRPPPNQASGENEQTRPIWPRVGISVNAIPRAGASSGRPNYTPCIRIQVMRLIAYHHEAGNTRSIWSCRSNPSGENLKTLRQLLKRTNSF